MSAPTVERPTSGTADGPPQLPIHVRFLAAIGRSLLRVRRGLRRFGTWLRGATERVGRSAAVAGPVAALSVALVGLAVVALPVAGAWWGGLEPAGSWQSAASVTGSVWVMAHGVPLRLMGVDYTLIPWGLLVIPAFLGHESGRWLVRVVRPRRWRTLVATWLITVIVGAGFVAAISVVADTSAVQTSARRALIAALILGAISVGSGLWRASDVARDATRRVPALVGVVLRASLVAFGMLVVFAAIVLVVAAAGSFGEISTVLRALEPTISDGIVVTILSIAYIPVFLSWSLAYMLGAGISLGPDVLISPFVPTIPAVPLPAFPPLAALPESAGPAYWAFPVLVVLAGGLAGLTVSRFAAREQPLIRLSLAVAMAALGAAWIYLALLLGRGSLGDGRLMDIGPDAGLGALLGGVGLLVGALPTSVLRARRKPRRLQAVAVEKDAPESLVHQEDL